VTETELDAGSVNSRWALGMDAGGSELLGRWWRAANYLSVGQTLLRHRLAPCTVGTTMGSAGAPEQRRWLLGLAGTDDVPAAVDAEVSGDDRATSRSRSTVGARRAPARS